MPSGGLLLLLDDVASLADAAARKTSGIVGDDLALNSKALIGIDPARELPIVWQVAKGSLKNKAILIPAALVLSSAAPWSIMPLMMAGGLYLCFEGAEKLLHSWTHRKDARKAAHSESPAFRATSPAALERQKIASAIRTDLILSAEIIVVTLGSVATADIMTKTAVLCIIGLGMTVVVYGAVGGLVKLDDIGLHLMEAKGTKMRERWIRRVGYALVRGTPYLLHMISILGTAAMFSVGGGIVIHGIAPLEHALRDFVHLIADGAAATLLEMLLAGLAGVAFGFLLLWPGHKLQQNLPALIARARQ